MRKTMFLIGITLLLFGVMAESMYVVSSKVAYNGPTLTADVYMLSGIILLLLGGILLLASVRIPEIHISDSEGKTF
jgi:hypothetical protein